MDFRKIWVFAFAFGFSPVAAAPLEEDAVFNSGWTRAHAQTLANDASMLVRRSRYRCDSVSSISSWATKPGFTVTCNGYRYKYYIEDKGGRWTVTLK